MLQCSPGFVACTRSIAGQTTSVYATHLGNISLTWGRSSLGLYLVVDLRLAPARTDDRAGHLRLCLHPYLPWKRKGSKRRRFTTPSGSHRTVELSWDLCAARFSGRRGPEPSDGFFVTVAVDGEIAVVAGDRKEEAYRTTSAVRPRDDGKGTDLISRRERVKFGGVRGELAYATRVPYGQKDMEMEISISSDPGEEEGMKLGIDGESVLEVKPLKWKFRGSDGVGVRSGGRIQVSWDLHGWFFRREGGGGGDSLEACEQKGEAVFVFRFERGDREGNLGKGSEDVFWEGGERGMLQKTNLSESSSGSSSATGSSSSMEEMSCVDESEARSSGEVGFTLIICGKKG